VPMKTPSSDGDSHGEEFLRFSQLSFQMVEEASKSWPHSIFRMISVQPDVSPCRWFFHGQSLALEPKPMLLPYPCFEIREQ
jgi:hypothetical protein